MSEPPHSEALKRALESADVADQRMARAMRRILVLVITVLSVVTCLVVGEGAVILGQEHHLQAEERLIRENQVDTHSLLRIVTAQSAALKAQSATLATLSTGSSALKRLADESALSRTHDEQFFYAICQGLITAHSTSAASRSVLRHLSACQSPR